MRELAARATANAMATPEAKHQLSLEHHNQNLITASILQVLGQSKNSLFIDKHAHCIIAGMLTCRPFCLFPAYHMCSKNMMCMQVSSLKSAKLSKSPQLAATSRAYTLHTAVSHLLSTEQVSILVGCRIPPLLRRQQGRERCASAPPLLPSQ